VRYISLSLCTPPTTEWLLDARVFDCPATIFFSFYLYIPYLFAFHPSWRLWLCPPADFRWLSGGDGARQGAIGYQPHVFAHSLLPLSPGPHARARKRKPCEMLVWLWRILIAIDRWAMIVSWTV
jgi:hypothetical protein